jgi:precorrin-2 methylase
VRKILIIGIGAGHPEHITIQAINALRQVNVLFITDKGADKDELARLRREVCARYIPESSHRIVLIPDPKRTTTRQLKRGTSSAPRATKRCSRNSSAKTNAAHFSSGAIPPCMTVRYVSLRISPHAARSNSNTKSSRASPAFRP